MGPVVLSLDGYRTYYAERAELWERQALLKARACAGDRGCRGVFRGVVRSVVFRAGVDASIVGAVRGMKHEIDRHLKEKGGGNVKLGRGGIREIEFLVQALQLLYGGDDGWLRERTTLKALFRLTERGYLAPGLGHALSEAYVHLRTVEHRLQILHEFQTHTLPDDPDELGRLARRVGVGGSPARAASEFVRRHRAVTTTVHRAFSEFFAERPAPRSRRVRVPSLLALQATGFRDPERARHNLRLILEGRPLVPYEAALGRAMERLLPNLLDAVWQSPDPDDALNQAEELAVGWRYLLGVTDFDGYSREMTALAEATLTAGMLLALGRLVERHGVPRTADGRFIPAVIVGLGKLGGRELTTGSDLDVFLTFSKDGETDGAERIEAHTFWSEAIERLARALGDITAPGVAFPVDLRLRPGSKGSGFASSVPPAERDYAQYGDLWERQTLTRSRIC